MHMKIKWYLNVYHFSRRFALGLRNIISSSYCLFLYSVFLFLCFFFSFSHLKVDTFLLLFSSFNISVRCTGRKNLWHVPCLLYHTLKNKTKSDFWNIGRIYLVEDIFLQQHSLKNPPLWQELNLCWVKLSEMIGSWLRNRIEDLRIKTVPYHRENPKYFFIYLL